jgi:hypothetical protein
MPSAFYVIKASIVLKVVHACRVYWHDVDQERGMMPNEFVLGFILEALACNGEVSEAVAEFLRCSTQGPHRAQTGAQVPWVVAGYSPEAHDAQRLHVECSRLQS